jgi:hypothetical protein
MDALVVFSILLVIVVVSLASLINGASPDDYRAEVNIWAFPTFSLDRREASSVLAS